MTQTIVDIFSKRVNELGPRAALGCRRGERWVEVSWKQWWDRAELVAAALLACGVERGDKVCMLGDTRIEWAWLELGIMMIGGVCVPLYPTSSASTCAAILNDVAARVMIVSDARQLHKLRSVREELPNDIAVICVESDPSEKVGVAADDAETRRFSSFDRFLAQGHRYTDAQPGQVAARRREVRSHDIATIVYSSGSMGEARGVVHDHASLLAEVRAWRALNLLGPKDRQLIFLPMAQFFSKILFFAALDAGAQTYFGGGLADIMVDMRDCKPTFIGGVPRIFKAIYRRVRIQEDGEARERGGAFGSKASGGLEFEGPLFERVLRRSLSLSRRRQKSKPLRRLQRVELWAYRHLYLERIQMLFGGELRFAFCVGAALDIEVAEFFHAAGVQILEGYGLCEAAGVSALNLPQEFRFGSVGKPLPDVDMTISEEGEVLVRGEMLMKGYVAPQAAIDPVLGEKGWFGTGDLGEFDRDGFLYIRGRKEHLIHSAQDADPDQGAAGKARRKIVPELIEGQLARRDFISHAVVYGGGGPSDQQAPLHALITLDETAKSWAIQRGIAFEARAELAAMPEVKQQVQNIVSHVNEGLADYERVQSFKIIARPFSLEANELTVSGKLRRDTVLAHHREWPGNPGARESLR